MAETWYMMKPLYTTSCMPSSHISTFSEVILQDNLPALWHQLFTSLSNVDCFFYNNYMCI